MQWTGPCCTFTTEEIRAHQAIFLLSVPCSRELCGQTSPLCWIHWEKSQVLMTMICFSEVTLDGRKFPALCWMYRFRHGSAQSKLFFLISHLIKLAVANFSSTFLGFVIVCFFEYSYFHIIKFLEAELYFCVVRTQRSFLFLWRNVVWEFSPNLESLFVSMSGPSKQNVPHVSVWNLHYQYH